MSTFQRMMNCCPANKNQEPVGEIDLFLDLMTHNNEEKMPYCARDFLGSCKLKKDEWQEFLDELRDNDAIDQDVYENMSKELNDRLSGKKKSAKRAGDRSMNMVARASKNKDTDLQAFRTEVFARHVQFFIHN